MKFSRRICWPDPDATCQGGCLYCNDNKFVSSTTIQRYVDSAGILPNRGIGEQSAEFAWQRGIANYFYHRVDVRIAE